MIKIIFIDEPLESPGGGQISLSLILKNLADKFYKLLLTTSDFDILKSDKKIIINDINILRIFFIIKRIKPNIIHCNSPTTRLAFYSAICSKILNIPFIWHVRVIESAGWRDKIIYLLSTKVIAISNAVKEKFNNKNKICVI